MSTKDKDKQVSAVSAIGTLAQRLGVEPGSLFLNSLRSVAFGGSGDITNEQLMALVVVANQYKLNPFTRELYAFPDRRTQGIVPIVSVDGWFRIINEHPMLDGIEYEELFDSEGNLEAGKATIYRKDRARPTAIVEYLSEVQRNTDPWRQHTHRMLRHKTIIQAGRVVFGFAGIYEPDEAERIIAATPAQPVAADVRGTNRVKALLNVPNDESRLSQPIPAAQAEPVAVEAERVVIPAGAESAPFDEEE